MKKLMIMAVAGLMSASAFAQSGMPPPNIQNATPAKPSSAVKPEVKKEIKEDKEQIEKEKMELNKDKADGNKGEVKQDKVELKNDKADLKKDKKVLRKIKKDHKASKAHSTIKTK